MQAGGPGHDQWEDATAAYVLGALDETERAAFEEHLAGCPACREEVDELRPAVEVLPISVEPVDPPPALKARIMAEVEREASLLAAAGPEADRPPAREPSRPVAGGASRCTSRGSCPWRSRPRCWSSASRSASASGASAPRTSGR